MTQEDIARRQSAQTRKAAWLKRREERIQKKKAEDMEYALHEMNTRKHYTPGDFHRMPLKELVETAKFLMNPDNNHAADAKTVEAAILKRGKRRGLTGSVREQLAVLEKEVLEREQKTEAEKKEKLAQYIEKQVKLLTEAAGTMGETSADERDFLDKVNAFYDECFAGSKNYFKVRQWTLDFAKKFILNMEGTPEWIRGDFATNKTYAECVNQLAFGVRRAMFGV